MLELRSKIITRNPKKLSLERINPKSKKHPGFKYGS